MSNNTASLVATGRVLIAIALIGFGVEHFLFGDFISGRAPAWPWGETGRIIWAWASGLCFILTGILILLNRSARTALIVVSTMVFFWALVRHIPILVADLKWGGELTQAGKALALWGGLLAVAGSLPLTPGKAPSIVNQSGAFIYLGRFCLATFLIICGIEHFIFLEFVASLVPTWIPGSHFWTYFGGIALIAGGAGLMIPATATLAGTLTGLMIFLWFLMLHIPRGIVINNSNEWTSVVEALAYSGVAWVLVQNGKSTR